MLTKKKIFFIFTLFGLLFLYNSGYSLLNIEVTGPSFANKPTNTSSATTGSSVGVGLGLALDLGRLNSSIMTQLKMDFMYHDFAKSSSSKATMYPIFLGFRFLFGNESFPYWLVPYIEAGYEARFFSTTNGSSTDSGATVGIGSEFYIYKGLYLGVNFRYHFLQDSFFTVGPAVGFRF